MRMWMSGDRSKAKSILKAAGLLLAAGLTVATLLATYTGTQITTDRNKYGVGETMIVSGSGYTPGQSVSISVLRPDHATDYVSGVIADATGNFSAEYVPSLPLVPGRYKITATDGTNSATTASTEADAAAADIDQCRNGSATNPVSCVDGGGSTGWVNGNVGSSQGHFVEGYSIPYRMKFTGVTQGTWTVDIGYDVEHSSKHAIDFLTQYERMDDPSHTLVFKHNPECVDPPDNFGSFGGTNGVCDNIAPTSTAAIPKPKIPDSAPIDHGPPCTTGLPGGNVLDGATSCPGTSFDAIAAANEAHFSMWGGTINPSLVKYVYEASGSGDLETRIRVVFTVPAGSDGNVVLGWGGHIAREQDWGTNNSAGGISGSPYHMRLKGLCSGSVALGTLCDSGGNQDRALAAAAVFAPPPPAVSSTLTGAVLSAKVEQGTVVHDTANIDTTSPSSLIPAGSTVSFQLFNNLTCTAPPITTYGPIAVPSGVQVAHVDSPSFTPAAGDYSYMVTFTSGDASVVQSGVGVCEPFSVILAATTLTLKSAPTKVESGDTVTVVVTETNTGTDPLTAVSVSGGGKCASFTGGATTLAAGASTDFTCTFTATAGDNAWSADGHGTDSLGNAVSATGEHAEGSVFGIHAATTLTLKSAPASVVLGATATVVVTETNTGNDPLTAVSVSGGGKCASFTGGATTLAVGASTDYTCTFQAVAGANAWFADGHGTDSLGNLVPVTNEHAEGSVFGRVVGTNLTLKSAPASVEAGTTATVIVTETNIGNEPLTAVSVSGGGKCASFMGGATTLAVGASTDYTCTFQAVAGANAWSADGHGTDSQGNAVPTTNEHASGSVFGVAPATALTTLSVTPAGSVEVGTLVTVVVTETNTGNSVLTGVNVTGGGVCASFTGGASTLALGGSTNFTCTFTAALGANSWFADGHGTDSLGNPVPATNEHASGSTAGLVSRIIVNKFSKGGVDTFNFGASGFVVPPITTTLDGSGNGTGTTGPIVVHPGIYSVDELTQPSGWKLDASLCSVDGVTTFGAPIVVGGVDVSWTFTIPLGVTVTCTFDNSKVFTTTRTQGFWATHTGLSNTVWATVSAADASLCGVPITATAASGTNQLMGGFWASISKVSTAKGNAGQRTDLDQVRMQMLQQYLAAVLNYYEFGSGTPGLLSTARTAYCGTDMSAIQAQIGILGTFNSSGDSGLFTPGVSATTQESKQEANIAFWDITVH
jgi:hypothetical protein